MFFKRPFPRRRKKGEGASPLSTVANENCQLFFHSVKQFFRCNLLMPPYKFTLISQGPRRIPPSNSVSGWRAKEEKERGRPQKKSRHKGRLPQKKKRGERKRGRAEKQREGESRSVDISTSVAVARRRVRLSLRQKPTRPKSLKVLPPFCRGVHAMNGLQCALRHSCLYLAKRDGYHRPSS